MPTSRTFAILALALSAALTQGAARAATPSADQIEAGRQFARRVCGACHVVTQQRDELPVLTPPGPSFAVLAQRPLLTEQGLREFLGENHRSMGPHEAMPNPRLADYQIDDRRLHDVAEGREIAAVQRVIPERAPARIRNLEIPGSRLRLAPE